jgi:RNA polymerase sigma factor (sigma-70 family)
MLSAEGYTISMSNRSLLKEWRLSWNRSLRQFLRRRVRTAVDIDDLAQETYLRLLRAPNLGEVRNPQAYLLKVASHVFLEWRDQQPPAEFVVTVDDQQLTDETSPELEVEANVSQARLEKTLAAVSPLMRAVLLLKLRDEKSAQQIAQELDITPRQVKRYLARGYALLHAALEN